MECLLCNIAETCGMLVLATVIPQSSVSRGIPLYIVFIGAHVFQWLPSGFFLLTYVYLVLGILIMHYSLHRALSLFICVLIIFFFAFS
uniref:Uncharacterized protein n=1 Tax=Brugia timori TaxID=42155 RepID=A0A0R3QFI3_9BILA